MYFINLAGPIVLIVMVVLMFLLVPWGRIQRLFPVSAVLGPALGTVTYYVLQNIVQAWHFQHADLVSLAGIPMFMTLAWIPYSIVYFHFLAQYRSSTHIILLILFAAAAPSFFHFLLEINNMLIFNNWPWWGNFLYALIIYNGLALLVYRRIKPASDIYAD